MTEIRDLKLTTYRYPTQNSQTISEIQHYLKAYDEAQWRLRLPFTKTSFNVIEFLSPMVHPRFIVPGVILMLFTFLVNLYILRNLSAQSAFLSYVMFMCANLGAALLLPTFLVTALNRINHARAKRKARKLKNDRSREIPHLDKISNQLVAQATEDYSPILTSISELLGSLKKDVKTEDIIDIFNHVFAEEPFDMFPLLADPEKYENGKNELIKILQKGLDYGVDIGMIADPKINQFLTYSLLVGFLKHEQTRPQSEYHFAQVDLAALDRAYREYRRKFLSHCAAEYGAKETAAHVEGRIAKMVDDYISFGKVQMERVFPDMEKSRKDAEEN